jgi:hypothetical protein
MKTSVAIAGLGTILSLLGLAPVTRAEAGDVRVGISIGLPLPPPVVVVEPPVVYAPPRVVYAPGPPVYYAYPHRHWHPGARAGRWKHVHEYGHHPHIPPGHYPPPGECRVWIPGRPPGHQPPPVKC